MAKRGGFPGGGMPGNMSNLMKQAQRMQREMLEDVIMAAVNEALRKADEASAANMAKLTGGLGGFGL